MFVKLAVLVCCVAATKAVWNGPLAGGVPASQYPAGVSPHACPNYPNCANPAVAASPNAAAPLGHYGGQQQWNNPAPQQWNNPAPQWNQHQGGQWNNAPAVPQWNGYQSPLDRGEYTGDGDYHGEGLAEAGAFGDISHNYNSNQNAGYNQVNPGAYNPSHPPAGLGQTPAGVDPHACPNYPFCH